MKGEQPRSGVDDSRREPVYPATDRPPTTLGRERVGVPEEHVGGRVVNAIDLGVVGRSTEEDSGLVPRESQLVGRYPGHPSERQQPCVRKGWQRATGDRQEAVRRLVLDQRGDKLADVACRVDVVKV